MPVNTVPPPSRAGPGRPPLDPRIRERLIAVRRAEGRRRLKWLCLLLGIAALGGTVFGITHSPRLAVHHVKVSGAVHTSREDVVTAAGLSRRPLMINVRSARSAGRVALLPWVDQATVVRRWPDTVDIRVTERVPVAKVAGPAGQPALVDRTGRVLAMGTAAAASFPALPAIGGLGPAGEPGSTLAGGQSALDALSLVMALGRGLPAAVATRVTGVSVAPDGQLTATVTPSATVRFGSADQLDAKVLTLATMLERVDLSGVATLDVRVPDAPVLTRPSRTGTVSTTPRG